MIARFFADLHYTEEVRDLALDNERAAFYQEAFNALAAPGADLLISLGDVSTSSNAEGMRHVRSALARAAFPVHYVYGNHDTMFVNEAHLDQIFGRAPNYAFDQGGVHFVVIDTTNPFDMVHWGGHLDEGQLTWLSSEVEAAQERPLVVMGHHALFGTTVPYSDVENHFVDNTREALEVLERHEGAPGIYLCGHTHHNGYAQRGSWHFLMLADVPDVSSYLELNFRSDAVSVSYRRFDDADSQPFAAGIPIYSHQGRGPAEDGCTFTGISIPR